MNFVFDVGNVLVDYEPLFFLEGLFPEKDLAKKLCEIIFRSPEWELMDQGVMTHTQACEVFCEREPEYKQEIVKTMQSVNTLFTPISETIELLPKIKEQHHGLYFLSNIHVEIRDFLLKEYGFFEFFDGGVFSCEIHITKPSPGIYRHFLEKYNLTPGECVFFDDMERNVKAAQAEGMQSVVYTGVQCVYPYLGK